MKFVYATGGREKYFKGKAGDCVTRAIANATGMDYREVYNDINRLAKSERTLKRRAKSSARNGVRHNTTNRYIEGVLGWIWVPCMGIGTGCQVHLRASELPSKGTYILSLSGHVTCWKDGVLYDTYDCSREGARCVYGYWREPTPAEKKAHDEAVNDLIIKKELEALEKADKAAKNKAIKSKNDKVKKTYAKKINALRAQIRKLERERDSRLIPLVK